MNGRQLRGLIVAAVAVTTLVACSSASNDGPSEPEAGTQRAPSSQSVSEGDARVVASGLDAPWSIAFYGDVPLISERDSARIVELDPSGTSREVSVLDDVAPRGEGGLLGLAVHEDHLYAYFTAEDENRVDRFAISGEPGALELGEAETILDGVPAAGYHNGGRIAFGPDGMLYVTAGDAGNSSDAQDTDALAGKILRLTPEGGVPADNPFDASPVYSYGHRNPQGIAWDEDGTMYASEFGQNEWDELNVIEPGGNYGWPDVEGIAGQDDSIDPVQQWEPAEASPSGITITGGMVYIANLRGERLYEVPLERTGESTARMVGDHGRLRDVVTAPDGSLWVLTNNTDGRGDPGEGDDRILRVDPGP